MSFYIIISIKPNFLIGILAAGYAKKVVQTPIIRTELEFTLQTHVGIYPKVRL